jgi:hypothetical protein
VKVALLKEGTAMTAKYVVVLIITSIYSILLCSCSDESAVSISPSETDNAVMAQTNNWGITEVDGKQRDTRVFVYAVTEYEKISARTAYASIIDVDFPLTIHQVEMITADEFVEITDQSLVEFIVAISFGEAMSRLEQSILKVGILSGEKNFNTDDWSCIKCCGMGIESCCCKRNKDEG